ncbi:asparagine synthase-related protein [Streptosporangium lutulentum]|uniref:Asparagine synthetase domain-containing protein n=1 Tax=Streptosporangium lutulentum TaxID=1461250 RepID=A0ABT9QHT4_9ACTN|nr:asparagine synthase-related protein [Streptosporangium lutulentum]MDP9845868.1 hypothetical protein [Streptosporangium lutulentum]
MAQARNAVEDVFPVPADTVTSAVWRGPDVVLLAWSNEGDAHRDPGLLIEANGHAVGVNGYLADPADGARLLAGEHADTLGGCFAVFRAGAGELSAMTTVTRACPVFYAENDEVHVVGSRALQVRLATRGGVRWNAPGLQSMIRQGYFLSDETPFDGVSALPPSSELLVRDGSRVIRTEALPRAEAVPEGARLKRAGVETLASALLAAVEPVRNATEPVNLALTGGRDSRLMAALLHAARIPFRATTNGLDDHPDVIIARRIARSLRIEHTVIAPKRTERKDAILVDHPLVRTLETLRTCEGMTSAYESIVGYLPYSPKPTMNGQSGEILRGGFLYSQGNLAPKALARRVDAFFLKDGALFTDEADAHARELAAPWQAMDHCEALDHLYVTHRVGRWHASARAGSLRRGDPVQPFLDNRVVRVALGLDPLWRHSEEVVHDLIGVLAPKLRGLPLEGSPWRFRKDVPPTFAQRLRMRVRPVPEAAARKGGGWNWRTSPGPVLSEVLRDGIDLDVLSGIVRPDAVKALLDVPELKQPALAWNLYTVSAMLNGLHLGREPVALEPVRVTVPGGAG